MEMVIKQTQFFWCKDLELLHGMPSWRPMTHVEILNNTVDGRNSAPVDMVKYHLIYRVLYIPSGDHRISSINSRDRDRHQYTM